MRFYFIVTAGSLGLVAAACGLETGGLLASDSNDGGGGGESVIEAGLSSDGGIEQADADAGSRFVGRDATSPSEDDDAAITLATPGDDSGAAWDEDSGDANLASVDAGTDAQCTGASWTCTAEAVPSGWRLVEYVESTRPACSTGYGSPINVVEGPTAPDATCACACNVTTAGSCESGSYTVSYNAAGATTCAGGSATVPANGGACSAVTSFTLTTGSKLAVTLAPYAPGSCTPAPTQSLPPIKFVAQGEVCNATSVSSAACPNGGVCAPAATGGGFDVCVVASGAQTCPPGFTHSHMISTGVTDSRACSACACGPDTATCANGQQSLFTEANCTSGGVSIPANDVCTDVPTPMDGGGDAGSTFVAIQYSAEVHDEACVASGGAPTGGVTLASVHTVCCE